MRIILNANKEQLAEYGLLEKNKIQHIIDGQGDPIFRFLPYDKRIGMELGKNKSKIGGVTVEKDGDDMSHRYYVCNCFTLYYDNKWWGKSGRLKAILDFIRYIIKQNNNELN